MERASLATKDKLRTNSLSLVERLSYISLWEQEISRHTQSLYPAARRTGFYNLSFVQRLSSVLARQARTFYSSVNTNQHCILEIGIIIFIQVHCVHLAIIQVHACMYVFIYYSSPCLYVFIYYSTPCLHRMFLRSHHRTRHE